MFYFKNKKFLSFFFKNLKINQTNRYVQEFPFVSFCGKECNYVNCSDLPFVFTSLDTETNKLYLNNTDTMNCQFKPELMYMSEKTGRVYYPLIENLNKLPTEIGLVKSSIVQELYKTFKENGQQSFFQYKSLLVKINASEHHNLKMSALLQKHSLFKE